MCRFLLSAAVIVGVGIGGLLPATATPPALSGLNSQSVNVMAVEKIGWRRYYRRHGYPVPYVYYPPAYGYYAPPPAYAYYPPAYDSYVPPPAVANGEYSSADGGYGDYPPANGEYGDYPPADGY
jgi:hypothetical protein